MRHTTTVIAEPEAPPAGSTGSRHRWVVLGIGVAAQASLLRCLLRHPGHGADHAERVPPLHPCPRSGPRLHRAGDRGLRGRLGSRHRQVRRAPDPAHRAHLDRTPAGTDGARRRTDLRGGALHRPARHDPAGRRHPGRQRQRRTRDVL
ncbi:hypothetical protein [Nocardioides convexus]|uniref:hypothetical protein n=1 Tax=Nocardioides convexus TaxID=2712224 RepID=UPI002418AD14|nr:hypothetical protein [Nocardioides convexus]